MAWICSACRWVTAVSCRADSMWHLRAVVAVVALAVCACAGSSVDELLPDHLFIGTLEARAELEDGKVFRRSGTGSAEFQADDDGGTRLVVHGDLSQGHLDNATSGDAGFVLDGRFEGGQWVGRGGAIAMTVRMPDGIVRGGGVVDGDRHALSGNVSKAGIDLTVIITPAAGSRSRTNGIERFVFVYALAAEDRADVARRERPTNGCSVIIYQPRMIANPGGDMMSQVQVPVCVP